MYYHLLDGDWASNALSWQWVSGTNSGKRYYANQENINRYTNTHQQGTFLDIPYDGFDKLECPAFLKELTGFSSRTTLPAPSEITINPAAPFFIYNWYNMDPLWQSSRHEANRILLLEPSVFDRYPVCARSIRFLLDLGQNIDGLQVFTGEFEELVSRYQPLEVHYREHPLNVHYRGIEHLREWLTDVRGEYRSFFAFWKKCAPFLERRFRQKV
jgi:deoxyribodipyrimidine photo-lyase